MVILEEGGVAQPTTRPAARGRSARVLAVYFLALYVLGLLAAYATPHLTWGMTVSEFAPKAGFQDPSSFITGALDVARHGWVTPPNYWLVRLWPPGFMLLEGWVLRLFGEESAFLLPLLVLSALCCAAWMLLLRKYLMPALPAPFATLAPALPFVFPVAPFFLFSPLGLGFGEAFAISFFIIGFLLVLLAARSGSILLAVAAGIALALSAYVRSQFELLVLFLTGGALVLFAFAAFRLLLKRPALLQRATLRVVLVSVIVAQLAMAPWRYHNFKDTGKAVWVHTSSLIARNALTPEQELLKLGGAFVVQGGGHLACKLEPSFCGKTEPEYFYRAFLQNPASWLWEKAKLLPAYWLAPPVPGALSSLGVAPTIPQILANLLLLAILVAGLWRLWRIRREPEFAVQAWFQLSFYGCLAAVYTLAHLEARYFYLPKIFAVVALLTLLVPGRARRTPNNEVKP